MIRRGVVFEERPNETMNVPIEDEDSLLSEPQGSPRAVELRRWFEKTEMVFGISECTEGKKVKEVQIESMIVGIFMLTSYNIAAYTHRFNELALICPRMVEPEYVKVDAYIRGLFENIKGEVTSLKPTNLNEAVRMAQKLMEQKLQAKHERDMEGNKRK
ncbi:hypothetical protein Tco_0144223 [Tanacetum coccineum]